MKNGQPEGFKTKADKSDTYTHPDVRLVEDQVDGLQSELEEMMRERNETRAALMLLDDERTDLLRRLSEAEATSEGRHKTLLQKSGELSAEWRRAEQAEAREARLREALVELAKCVRNNLNCWCAKCGGQCAFCATLGWADAALAAKPD